MFISDSFTTNWSECSFDLSLHLFYSCTHQNSVSLKNYSVGRWPKWATDLAHVQHNLLCISPPTLLLFSFPVFLPPSTGVIYTFLSALFPCSVSPTSPLFLPVVIPPFGLVFLSSLSWFSLHSTAPSPLRWAVFSGRSHIVQLLNQANKTLLSLKKWSVCLLL